jgi:hypothetical protein
MRLTMNKGTEKEKGFIEKMFDSIENKLKKISEEEKQRDEGELVDEDEYDEDRDDEEAKEAYDADSISASSK